MKNPNKLIALLFLSGCATPINHRYEVYLKNDVSNDLLYESNSFDIAEEYVDFYKDSHSDIYIYDLIKQEFVANK
jgi:hypothetical protein